MPRTDVVVVTQEYVVMVIGDEAWMRLPVNILLI